MSNLIPLVDLSSSLLRKVRDRWFNNRDEKMENSRREIDPFAERPETWYKGPLIFPPFPEEGTEDHETFTTAKVERYEEAWSD